MKNAASCNMGGNGELMAGKPRPKRTALVAGPTTQWLLSSFFPSSRHCSAEGTSAALRGILHDATVLAQPYR
eukprot:CAMPEP_0115890868 /NCGR_PEP_ID=MMETSP0287-20121206/33571_1 /TAXON_ID=412157 /ORGANISM="Chrysochromulina rotalis, Strain UIO044" /LENGTH=71 /DNA_ID=CAMNT_0003347649 /DNA_START=583 /DNA_END=798 /DNA_ORIENTATION=+